MTGHRDDRNPIVESENNGGYTGAAQDKSAGHAYKCHACGFTRTAAAPPQYCPRCHAETHPESS